MSALPGKIGVGIVAALAMLGISAADFSVARPASAGQALAARSSLPASSETLVYSFCSQPDPSATADCLDGSAPDSVIEGSDGNLYGTTEQGGANLDPSELFTGTFFKLTPSGSLTVLHSFCSQQDASNGICLDGNSPQSGVIKGKDGNFYGATRYGGANGYGTVYKITPSGTLTTLYSFCSRQDPSSGDCLDGYAPNGVIEGSDGNFYGTAGYGGAFGAGTVFELTPSGTLTTLYSFCGQVDPSTGNCVDGGYPDSLIEASDGNFYGTTYAGGEFGNATSGGTVFKLTPSGTLTVLHAFCSTVDTNSDVCVDGNRPGGLIEGSDGNLYGTTIDGGSGGGYGTVFKVTTTGTLTTLHFFCTQVDPYGDCLDGAYPPAGVIEGSDGNFYGATQGTVFMLTPTGELTTLHSFTIASTADGEWPSAGLIEASDGSFYGTTWIGGANGAGTVFRVTAPSSTPPPPPAQPNLTISPRRGSFGKKLIGTTTAKIFRVRANSRNKNATPAVLEAITLTGGDYSLDSADSTCVLGQGLAPRQECEIIVEFTPSLVTKGLTDTATLTVLTSAGKIRPQGGVIALKGGGKVPK